MTLPPPPRCRNHPDRRSGRDYSVPLCHECMRVLMEERNAIMSAENYDAQQAKTRQTRAEDRRMRSGKFIVLPSLPEEEPCD